MALSVTNKPIDITQFVRAQAKKTSNTLTDISKISHQLLTAISSALLADTRSNINNLVICIDNGTTLKGQTIIKFLLSKGLSPAQATLVLLGMHRKGRSPGTDNLVRYSFTELKNFTKNEPLQAALSDAARTVERKVKAKNKDPLGGLFASSPAHDPLPEVNPYKGLSRKAIDALAKKTGSTAPNITGNPLKLLQELGYSVDVAKFNKEMMLLNQRAKIV